MFNCEYCGISIKHKPNLYRHMNKSCKKSMTIKEKNTQEENKLLVEKLNNIIEEHNLLKSELMQMKNSAIEEVNELKSEIEQIKSTPVLVHNNNNNINITQNIIYYNNIDAFELMENKLTTQGAVEYYLIELPMTKDTTPVINEIIDQYGESSPFILNKNNDLEIYVSKDRKEPLIDNLGNYLVKQAVKLCIHASHKAYGISAQNAPNIDTYPEEYNRFMMEGKGKHPSLEKWNRDKETINDITKKSPTGLLKAIKIKIKNGYK